MLLAEDRTAVAVTGANGFVGSVVVRHLVQQNIPAIAISRKSGAEVASEWRPLPDLRATSDYRQLFSGVDSAIHCAARVHVMKDTAADPLGEFREVNRDATLALAEAAAAAGVKRFVFVSSIKVNGEATEDGAPFGPDDPPRPVDPYGISKWEAEKGLRDIERRTAMAVIIVRPVLVYGPGVRANFAAIARLAQSGLPLPFGAVGNRRSLIFVENLADLLVQLATRPLPSRRIFLASDGAAVSTSELVRLMAHTKGRRARLLKIPPRLIRVFARLCGQSALTDRLFGSLETDVAHLADANWSPPFTMAEGLARTFGVSVGNAN